MRKAFWLPLSLLLAADFVSAGEDSTDEKKEEKKEKDGVCVFRNPDQGILVWAVGTKANSCSAAQLLEETSDEEKERRSYGTKSYAFNVLASDRLGPSRPLEDLRHELCKDAQTHDEDLSRLAAAVVIVYHNEATSVLVRMVNSILERTPTKLLHAIVLLDDWSAEQYILEEKLKRYGESEGWPMAKIIMERTAKREGLIRARVLASRLTEAPTLVFLDSHCEVGDGWLEPLLRQLREKPKSAAVPIVDIISPKDFSHSNSMITHGGFDKSLRFQWRYFPWSHFDDESNYAKPYKTAAMSGGLVAVSRVWWRESGEYDEGMEIWGAENVELSLRMWLCGEGVWVAPCSRVAHVFRYSRPYGLGPNSTDTLARNAQRTARLWFSPEYQEAFRKANPKFLKTEAGDLTARKELKERLNCRDFDWYVKEVYPEVRQEFFPTTKTKDEL